MSTGRSDVAYGYWRDASEKFDYFITGVTGALAAYVGQTLQPFRIGPNPETVELVALGLLVASAIAGFKRIEASITLYSLQHQRLYSEETRAALMGSVKHGIALNEATGDLVSAPQALIEAREHGIRVQAIREKLDAVTRSASFRYRWRNGLLFVGFAALVIARILPAYVH